MARGFPDQVLLLERVSIAADYLGGQVGMFLVCNPVNCEEVASFVPEAVMAGQVDVKLF
ncbi:MAG: hypothetical protein GTN65_14580 [Armatimonadetes bacterium]|nr:hypothetical protein [Armatimonadota bacterium]NIO98287.1 hypothetical protein [Armatimonadota bacterium]